MIFTNEWFYKEVVSIKLQPIITYKVFQKICTVCQLILMIIIISANIKWINLGIGGVNAAITNSAGLGN